MIGHVKPLHHALCSLWENVLYSVAVIVLLVDIATDASGLRSSHYPRVYIYPLPEFFRNMSGGVATMYRYRKCIINAMREHPIFPCDGGMYNHGSSRGWLSLMGLSVIYEPIYD